MRSITRRSFLFGTARAATSAGTLLTALPSKVAANDRVIVGIIGVGGMGLGHIKHLITRQDAVVAAVSDVDNSRMDRAVKLVKESTGGSAKTAADFRRLLDDKFIDAVIVATPHHWHCPIAIRALEAGKDVYVEKPGSHVFREGRLLVEAARKQKRIVQHGTQMRSSDVTIKARELLDSGVIGQVKMSKAWNQQRHTHRQPVPDTSVPPGVDYEMWLGPAPRRAFNSNRFHGNWNWYRDYGNGDIGGDGIHDLDMALFGLNPKTHPVRITGDGSRIDLAGEREFPDNMSVAYHFEEGKVLLYEERGWTPYGHYGFDSGNAFYGTEGFMVFSRRGYFQVYLGKKEEPGPSMRGGGGHPQHLFNFLDCVRSRQQPIAPAETAHRSCALVHLGEIAYRVQRVLHFDPKTETITNDKEANQLLTKRYAKPWQI